MNSKSELENLILHLDKIKSEINIHKLNNEWYYIFEKLIIFRYLEQLELIDTSILDETWKKANVKISNNKLEFLHTFEREIDEFLISKVGIDKNIILNLKIPKDIASDVNDRHNFLGILITSINEFLIDRSLKFGIKNDQDLLGVMYESYILRNEKETGSYYTPDSIIRYMCKKTVEQQFEMLLGDLKRVFENPNIDIIKCTNLIKKFTSIKILDPACGCGKFLMESLRILFKEYRKLNELLEKVKEQITLNEPLKHQLEKIINPLEIEINKNPKKIMNNSKNIEQFPLFLIIRHIFGTDNDSNAVNIARLSLWIQILTESFIDSENNLEYKSLTEINSVTRSIFGQLGINILVGNSLTGGYKRHLGTIDKINDDPTLNKLMSLKTQLLKDPSDFSLYDDYNLLKTDFLNKINENFHQQASSNYSLNRHQVVSEFSSKNGIQWLYQFEDIFYDRHRDNLLHDSLKEEKDEKDEKSEKETDGFDIIIGNPPYISSKDLEKEFKEVVKKKYSTAVNQFDTYTVFIELSYYLLKKRGLFAFIIPESYLGRSQFSLSRKFLIENTLLSEIDQISGVFEDPSVSNIIIFFEKQSPATYRSEIYKKSSDDWNNNVKFSKFGDLNDFQNDQGTSIIIPQKYFLKNEHHRFLFITEKERNIIKKIRNNSTSLGEIIEIHRGEEIGRNSEIIQSKNGINMKKILFGKDVQNYQILFNENYISLKNIGKKQNFSLYFQPKIVLRQLGDNINAAFDKNGEYVTLQTIYNIKLMDKRYLYEYILAVLNSDLMQFYYSLLFKEKKLFPRILLENIKKLPIHSLDLNEQRKISSLVEELIDSNSSKIIQENHKIETTINALIFVYYSLNEEEIHYILNYVNQAEQYQNDITKLIKNPRRWN